MPRGFPCAPASGSSFARSLALLPASLSLRFRFRLRRRFRVRLRFQLRFRLNLRFRLRFWLRFRSGFLFRLRPWPRFRLRFLVASGSQPEVPLPPFLTYSASARRDPEVQSRRLTSFAVPMGHFITSMRPTCLPPSCSPPTWSAVPSPGRRTLPRQAPRPSPCTSRAARAGYPLHILKPHTSPISPEISLSGTDRPPIAAFSEPAATRKRQRQAAERTGPQIHFPENPWKTPGKTQEPLSPFQGRKGLTPAVPPCFPHPALAYRLRKRHRRSIAVTGCPSRLTCAGTSTATAFQPRCSGATFGAALSREASQPVDLPLFGQRRPTPLHQRKCSVSRCIACIIQRAPISVKAPAAAPVVPRNKPESVGRAI